MPRKPVDIPALITSLKAGDRYALSRAITIIESERSDDQHVAKEILDECLDVHHNTLRVGVTGPPGVGKSSYIEKLGLKAISDGLKVAVLAIDPTSNVTRGSILGDKTRMQDLSNHEKSFIRPSPTAGHLGGVATKTRETIRLCEAAGYDLIIIETVGVGQSEIAVKNISDCFVLLLQPGSGDELQGIKRGIMELADIAVINKADGNQLDLALKAKKEFNRALHILTKPDSHWTPKVILHSMNDEKMISNNWAVISEYAEHIRNSGWLLENRSNQQVLWFDELLKTKIIQHFYAQNNMVNNIAELRKQVAQQEIHPYRALEIIFSN